MGGTSGMGLAAAQKFVSEGAQVLSVGKPQETALNDDQIQEYKRGGYYIEDLPHAQDGIPQGTTIAADPTLTYAEYYAQTADAAKKAYDDYLIQSEKEKQRVLRLPRRCRRVLD